MRIIDLISKDSVKLNLVSKDKLSVIDELVELVDNSGNLNDSDEYKEAILAREELSTTSFTSSSGNFSFSFTFIYFKNSSILYAFIKLFLKL